jgi:hypothetical protein
MSNYLVLPYALHQRTGLMGANHCDTCEYVDETASYGLPEY